MNVIMHSSPGRAWFQPTKTRGFEHQWQGQSRPTEEGGSERSAGGQKAALLNTELCFIIG